MTLPPQKEAPENTSPKDLPLGEWYRATLWTGKGAAPFAKGGLTVLLTGDPEYDGIFVPDDPKSANSEANQTDTVSVGNFQTQSIQVVDVNESDTFPRIFFRWAGKSGQD
jgi:hypothetical protein